MQVMPCKIFFFGCFSPITSLDQIKGLCGPVSYHLPQEVCQDTVNFILKRPSTAGPEGPHRRASAITGTMPCILAGTARSPAKVSSFIISSLSNNADAS